MRYLLGVFVLLGVIVAGCTAPPSETTYTEPQLNYLLLDYYGEDRFFFCDPDYYPISRDDEQEKAIEAFPAIRNSNDEFDAIVQRTGLAPPFSGEAQLAIYREHKLLQAIPLTPATAHSFTYSMQLGTEGEGAPRRGRDPHRRRDRRTAVRDGDPDLSDLPRKARGSKRRRDPFRCRTCGQGCPSGRSMLTENWSRPRCCGRRREGSRSDT